MVKLLILIHDSWLSYYNYSKKKKSHFKASECHFVTDYSFKTNIENFFKHNFLISRVPSCDFVVILHTQQINSNSILNYPFPWANAYFCKKQPIACKNKSFFYKIVGRKKHIKSVNLLEVFIRTTQVMPILNINQIANAKLLSSNNFTYHQEVQELTFYTIVELSQKSQRISGVNFEGLSFTYHRKDGSIN